MQNVTSQHASMMDILRATHEREKEELITLYQTSLTKVQQSHEHTVQMLESTHTQDHTRMQKQYQEEIHALQDRLEQCKQTYAAEKQQLTSKYKIDISELHDHYASLKQDTEAHHAKRVKEIQTVWEDKLGRIMEDHVHALKLVEEKHSLDVSQYKASIHSKVDL